MLCESAKTAGAKWQRAGEVVAICRRTEAMDCGLCLVALDFRFMTRVDPVLVMPLLFVDSMRCLKELVEFHRMGVSNPTC